MVADPCITTLGLNAARDVIKDMVNTDWLYCAAGTGTTTPSASDTTLEGEISGTRKARQETTEVTASRTISYLLNSIEGNGSTIKKLAVFDADSGGTMHFVILLDSSDYIEKDNTVEVWVDFTAVPTVTDAS
jgi:hypothetical protein